MAVYKNVWVALVLALCVVGSWQHPQGRRGGGRRDGGRGDRRGPPPPCRLEDPATGDSIPSDRVRECPAEVTCSLGPVPFELNNGDLVVAFFCDKPLRFQPLLKFACKVDSEATGETIRERECRDSAQCILGPLSLADRDGEMVAASFCDDILTSEGPSPYKGVLSQACSLTSGNDVLIGQECPEDATCSVGPLDVIIDGSDATAFFCDIEFEDVSRHHDSASHAEDGEEDDDMNVPEPQRQSPPPQGDAQGQNPGQGPQRQGQGQGQPQAQGRGPRRGGGRGGN